MGIRLIVEVLDHWKDFGLTAGERDDLIVIAENANDGTRETYSAIHEAYVLKRVNKSAASWRIAINRLMKKKALEYAVHNGRQMRGHTGQCAVYRLTVLCPDPPHDGWHGFCTRPDRVIAQETQPAQEGYPSANAVEDREGYSTANPPDGEGYPSANAVGGVGYLTATERVSQQLTPTPPSPSTTSSPDASTVTESSAGQGGGGGEQQQQHQGASLFVDALDYRSRRPSRSQRLKLSKLVADALGAGWPERDLKTYLDLGDAPVQSAAAIYLHRLNPDELPEPPAPRTAPKPEPGCPKCDDGYYDTGNGWAACPHCNRNAA